MCRIEDMRETVFGRNVWVCDCAVSEKKVCY